MFHFLFSNEYSLFSLHRALYPIAIQNTGGGSIPIAPQDATL
jgi:hypothetical protein